MAINSISSYGEVFIPSAPLESVALKDIKQNFDANFTRPIFDIYFQQIGSIALKLEHLPLELKAVLLQPGDTVLEKKAIHKKIVLLLREMIETKNLDNAVREDVNALSAAIFSQVSVPHEHEKLLREYVDLTDERINSQSLQHLVNDLYFQLTEKFKYSGIEKESTIKDYHYQGFLPVELYTIGDTHYLHTPNPMIWDKSSNLKTMNPVFLSYLQHLKKEQKRHLYINVKSMSEEWIECSQKEEYKDALLLIAVDRGSDFYYQDEEWKDKSDAIEFKKNFKNHIFTDSKHFYWPSFLLENGWTDHVSDLIDQIHENYFQNRTTLTQDERGAFIEIANAEMIAAVCERYKPDFANATCEYTMDRGPSQYAFTYFYDILKKRGTLTTEEKREFLTLFFVPPIIIHNRTSHEYRVERLVKTLEVLSAWIKSD